MHVLKEPQLNGDIDFIPTFFFRKKGILNSCQSRSVVPPSVCTSVWLAVRPCVRPSVTFLVNVSPPKPLEEAISDFVVE